MKRIPIQLTEKQETTLRNFLTQQTKEQPANVSEWLDDWCYLCNIDESLHLILANNVLELSEDEMWPLHNFLTNELHTIKEEKKGEDLFNSTVELTRTIHDKIDKTYALEVYCSLDYGSKPSKSVLVDPSSDPIKVFTEKEKKQLEHFAWVEKLNASGYAGVNQQGTIVDRREHPEAIPIQKNSMFGVVEPKKLPTPTPPQNR